MANLRLHHVNVTSDHMPTLVDFYKNALGLDLLPSPQMIATSAANTDDGNAAWDNSAKFFNAGRGGEDLEIHATQRQPYLAAQEGHSVNPLIAGHFAFRTDDLDAIKKQLDDAGVPYDDWGVWSVEGWHQIFLTDPAGNYIEIHQLVGEAAETED